jgi:gliding motility-associated-like protein
MPCGKLFFPNAFSPNGDGENDVWKIYGDCIVEMEIKIFNRWGEVVYSSTSPDDIWDGMVRGKQAEAAVFYYIFNGSTTDGEVFEGLKGTITLMK